MGPVDSFSKSSDGGFLGERRLCVPVVEELRNKILTEAHNSPFSLHRGGNKMYEDLKQHFV